EQSEPADARGWLVRQGVGVRQVAFQRSFQGWQRLFIKAQNQLLRCWRGQDFIKQDLKARVRNDVEAERGFAHFTNPLPERCRVFGTEIRLQAEAHFEFVNRFGGDASGENLVETFERVMITLEPPDTFLNR